MQLQLTDASGQYGVLQTSDDLAIWTDLGTYLFGTNAVPYSAAGRAAFVAETDDVKGYKPTPRASYNAEHGHHSNGELRGTKADIWEGGHRVPFIVRWPAKVKPAVSAALIELNDTLATLAEITGTVLPPEAGEDSISFLPTLLDAAKPARTFSVHHSLNGVFALREGPWKYVPTRGSGGFSSPKQVKVGEGESSAQLYHLADDLSESHNVASDHSGIVARMEKRLTEIQSSTHTRH